MCPHEVCWVKDPQTFWNMREIKLHCTKLQRPLTKALNLGTKAVLARRKTLFYLVPSCEETSFKHLLWSLFPAREASREVADLVHFLKIEKLKVLKIYFMTKIKMDLN